MQRCVKITPPLNRKSTFFLLDFEGPLIPLPVLQLYEERMWLSSFNSRVPDGYCNCMPRQGIMHEKSDNEYYRVRKYKNPLKE